MNELMFNYHNKMAEFWDNTVHGFFYKRKMYDMSRKVLKVGRKHIQKMYYYNDKMERKFGE